MRNIIWSRRKISADKWSDWCPGKSEILEVHYIESTMIQGTMEQMMWRRKLIWEWRGWKISLQKFLPGLEV